MNAQRDELGEGSVLYINGKRFGVVEEPRFISEYDGIEQWEMRVEPSEY